MRFLLATVAVAMVLLIGAQAATAQIPPTGRDNRLEWEVRANWQVTGTTIDFAHSLDGKLVFVLDADHQVSVYDNTGQLQGRMLVGEGVTSIDIAPQGELLYLIDDATNTFTAVAMSYIFDIDVTGSPFQGNPEAPVTIAVFTDFE